MRKLIAIAILLTAGNAWGATYYMRADGTAATKAASTGPCDNAAKTMSVAGQNGFSMSAGDLIYICDDGGNYSAQVTLQGSVTYQNAPGDSPHWDMAGADAYAFLTASAANVTVRGITADNTIKSGGVIGIVNASGGTIDNCTLSSKGGTVVSISGTGGSHTLKNSFIIATAIGSANAINSSAPNNIIDNNVFTNTTVTNPRENGYAINAGDNLIIRNNTFGTSASNGFFGSIILGNVSGVQIYNNNIGYSWNGLDYNHSGKGYGVYVNGANAANNIVRNNYIHDCQRGYLEGESVNNATGNNQVYYNIFDNNTTNGIDVRYTGAGTPPNIFNNVVIHHVYPDQTTEANSIGHGIVVQNGGVSAVIKNNIVTCDQLYANAQCIYLNDGSGDTGITSVVLSNNLYYPTNGAHLGKLNTATNPAVTFDTIAAWQTGLDNEAGVTTKETDSKEGDPRFTSSTVFTLQSSSPAINAGVDVGLTSDIRGMVVPQGSAPDIGAYEFGPGDPGFLKGVYRGRMGIHWLW